MPIRRINIALTQQKPRRETVRFVPSLTPAESGLLLASEYLVTTESDGTAVIDLPVKDTGTIRYRVEVPFRYADRRGVEVSYFHLEAGDEIDLTELIDGNSFPSVAFRDYLEARAIRYDLIQTLTNDQKAAARANIGIGSGIGSTWLTGNGEPDGSLGDVGDLYLDAETGDVYEKTHLVTWTLTANIRGPEGPPGADGQDGADGAGIEIAGSVATYANLPDDLGTEDAGQAYFVEADGRLYIWDGTDFPTEGNGVLFQGPAGADGADGEDGEGVPTGGSTGQVLKKASNADFDTEWAAETGGGSGDVTGAAESIDNEIPIFSGTGGKTLKQSGATITDGGGFNQLNVDVIETTEVNVLDGGTIYTEGNLIADVGVTTGQVRLATSGLGRVIVSAEASSESTERTIAINANAGNRSVSLSGDLTVSANATVSGTNTGDQDLTALNNHAASTSNPHSVTAAQVGLGNVDNTSDATKNTATATLENKTLVTPTIASFANAAHTHADAAGGGQLGTSALQNGAVTAAKIENFSANTVVARAAGTSGSVSGVALAASQLLGRGSTGDVAAITLGTGLTMSGTTLNAPGGSGEVGIDGTPEAGQIAVWANATDIGGEDPLEAGDVTAKTTPVDADVLIGYNSESDPANQFFKTTWANIKATLKTYFDTLYQVVLVSGTNIKTVNSTSLLGSGDVEVQATLVSGTNIKTINSESLLGSGNIVIEGGGGGVGSGTFSLNDGSASVAGTFNFNDGDAST